MVTVRPGRRSTISFQLDFCTCFILTINFASSGVMGILERLLSVGVEFWTLLGTLEADTGVADGLPVLSVEFRATGMPRQLARLIVDADFGVGDG